jgi:hypothetical protein
MADIKDFELISAERRAQIAAEAKKKVLEERRKEAEKLLLAAEMKKFEAEGKPEEEERSLLVNLPGHAMDVKLDGKAYEHGQTYVVKKRVYDSLKDIIARAWEHEDEIGQANNDLYRRRAMSPGPGKVLRPSDVQGARF